MTFFLFPFGYLCARKTAKKHFLRLKKFSQIYLVDKSRIPPVGFSNHRQEPFLRLKYLRVPLDKKHQEKNKRKEMKISNNKDAIIASGATPCVKPSVVSFLVPSLLILHKVELEKEDTHRHSDTKGSNNKDATIVVVGGDNPSLQIHANTHCAPMTSDGNILDKSSICLEYSDRVCGGVVGNQDVVIRVNKEVEMQGKLTNTNMTNKIALGIKN